ncbi:MAG: CDP-alcohol phosphatidyltransferase family protein [Rhodospirillales bacterium]|nr:CDP-alcohol phosphatidyltransferase family protein [Rhodospirillales bacterium]
MSHNTWIHRGVRIVLVKPLAKTPVTPNQVTVARIATGLAAAAALAMGDPLWSTWGAGLFVLSILMDRADGDLARLTGKTSPLGHTLDLISDASCNTLIFVGLGLGLRGGGYGLWAIAMGIVAGASVGVILWRVMQIEETQGARAAELGSYAGFDPDDAMLAVPLMILLGGSEPLLLAAFIGAPAFAVFFFLFTGRRLS